MEQITIFQWQEWKEDIRRKLQEAAEDFVYIGYRLKQIIESEAYKQDGYEDIFSFAQEEYGLSKSVTSRFIAINNKFSIEGNSEKLKEEYAGFLNEIIEIYSGYFDRKAEINNIWTKFYGIVAEKEPEKEPKKEEPKEPQHSVKSSNSVATSQQKEEEEEDAEGETEELEEVEESDSEESEENDAEDEDEQGEELEEQEEETEADLPEGVEETPYKKLKEQAWSLAGTIYQSFGNEHSEIEQLDIQKRNAEQIAAILEQMIEMKKEEEECN